MKKVIVFLLAIAIPSVLLAQITIMPKGGLVVSSLKFDDSDVQDDVKSRVGFLIGVNISKTLSNEALSIQGELNFIKKGVKIDANEGFFGYDEEWDVAPSYLEIPVMLKYSLNEGQFFFEGGLSLGLLVGGKATIEGREDYQFGEPYESGDLKIKGKDEDFFTNFDDEFYLSSSTDLGIQLGAGAKLGTVVLGLRYGIGLTKVFDYDIFGDNISATNRTLQITIGYPINR